MSHRVDRRAIRRSHGTVRRRRATGARRLSCPDRSTSRSCGRDHDLHLAAPEPGSVLDASPDWPPGRRRLRSTLHLPLAAGEDPYAPEAHANFGMFAQSDEAGLHGAVTAAPATGGTVRGFEGVGANRGQSHAASLPSPGSSVMARSIEPMARHSIEPRSDPTVGLAAVIDL